MIDDIIYQWIIQTAALQDYLKGNGVHDKWRVYPKGALGSGDIPSKPKFPYVQYGELYTGENAIVMDRAETRLSNNYSYQIFVYDDPGSFQRIKRILMIMRDRMNALVGQTSTSGFRITDAAFHHYGDDGYDPIAKQNAKLATYTIVASRN